MYSNETIPSADSATPVPPTPVVMRALCVRAGNPTATCALCADVCPVDAVHIAAAGEGDGPAVRIDTDTCLACNLCAGACPTQALTYVGEPLALIRQRIDRIARHYDTVYLTCRETEATAFSGAICEVPCLGQLPVEFWFSLLTDLDGIAVFLPLGLCDSCTCPGGEQRMMDAIAQAERWSGSTLGLVTEKEDLDFYVLHGDEDEVDRRAFLTSIGNRMSDSVRKVGVQGPGALSDRSETARRIKAAHDEAVRRRDEQFAEAHETGRFPMNHRMYTPTRKLLADALAAHPELAERVRITVSETDAQVCTTCKACIGACPVRARRIWHMRVHTDVAYCVGCGKCLDVCPMSAIHLVETDARSLLTDD